MATDVKPVYISKKLYRFHPPLVERCNMYFNADYAFWAGTGFVSRPRYGTWQVWDFASDLAAQGPSLTPCDSLTFELVSDQRSEEMLKIIQREQSRLAVLWSGGIDSTVILAALIRNWSAADLAQVDVVMNVNSYLENPVFYRRAIEAHGLRTISVDDLYSDAWASRCITDGEPADKLWLVKVALAYARAHGSDSLKQPWQKSQSRLTDFFADRFRDRNQCAEYFELVAENITQTGAPVENTGDWFWWINFNWHWAGHLWYAYVQFPQKNPANYQFYQRRYHAWYNSLAYQQWSFGAQGRAAKHFDSISEYKMPAKQYINSVVPNAWYMEFKTKSASTTRFNGLDFANNNTFAIYQDGSVFNDHDPEAIGQFVDRYLLI